MTSILKDCLTGIDGESFDVGRVLWVLGVLFFVALSAYSLYRGGEFDPLNSGAGYGAILGGGGAGIGLKRPYGAGTMTAWAKIGLFLGWTLVSFVFGCYVTTKFDEAAHAKTLQAQLDADQKAMHDADVHAADLEHSLAGERLKETEIIQRMETQLAKTPDCRVPDGVVRLLNSAITAPVAAP